MTSLGRALASMLLLLALACGGGRGHGGSSKPANTPLDPIDPQPIGAGPTGPGTDTTVTPVEPPDPAPSGPVPAGSPLLALRQFTDELCLCPDSKCAEGVMQRLQVFAQQFQNYKATPAEQKEAEILVQRLVQCYQRLLTVTVTLPPPTPAPTPPTP